MQKYVLNFIIISLLGFSINICLSCEQNQPKEIVASRTIEKTITHDSIPEIKNRNFKKIIEALIANDDSLAKNLTLLKVEGDSNIFILDITQKVGVKKNRYYINKYNSDLELLARSEIFSGVYIDWKGCDLKIDKNENIYISGKITSDVIYRGDNLIKKNKDQGFLSKFDNNGKLLWITKLPKSYDGAHSRIFICDSNKNISVLTYSKNLKQKSKECDLGLISYKVSLNGKIINHKKYPCSFPWTFSEISIDQAGNFITISHTNRSQLSLIKFNKNGKEILNNKSENARKVGLLNSITHNNFIYISGWMEGWNKKEFKFQNKKIENLESKNCLFIGKFDFDGNCIWIKSIDSNYGQAGDLEIIDNQLLYSFLSYNSTELFLNLVELNQDGIIVEKHKDFLEYKENLVSVQTEVSNSNTVSFIGSKVKKIYVNGKREKQYTSVAGKMIFNE